MKTMMTMATGLSVMALLGGCGGDTTANFYGPADQMNVPACSAGTYLPLATQDRLVPTEPDTAIKLRYGSDGGKEVCTTHGSAIVQKG